MSAEENKAVFRRYVDEVGNEGNLGLVDEIFDIYISHQPDGHTEERGRENVKRFMGEFRGLAPSGKRITVTGIGIFRFSEEEGGRKLGQLQSAGHDPTARSHPLALTI